LYRGQKAKIKFTAYNFSKYGSMDAKLINISADTIISRNRRGGSYYLVKLETEKNYIGSKENPLKIIPGMTVSADILVGKRTVFEYLIEPVFKVFDNAMREK
jgi:adhesin transport system membrane fusion protein